jgi:hypothetical protein
VKSRGRSIAIESPASAEAAAAAEEAAGEARSGKAELCNEAFDCLRKERDGEADDRRAKNEGSRLRRLRRLSEMVGELVGVDDS